MYHPSYLTPKTRERIIAAQTAARPMTLAQEIDFLTRQIDRLHSEGAHEVATRKEIEREELRARYFVSQLPDAEKAVKDFDAETQIMKLFAKLADADVYPDSLRLARRAIFIDQINEAAPAVTETAS